MHHTGKVGVSVDAPATSVCVNAPAGDNAANEDDEGAAAAANVNVPAAQVAVGTPWATVVHTPGGTAVRVGFWLLALLAGWR